MAEVAGLFIGLIALVGTPEPAWKLIESVLEHVTGKINDKVRAEAIQQAETCELQFKDLEECVELMHRHTNLKYPNSVQFDPMLVKLRAEFQKIVLDTKQELTTEARKSKLRSIGFSTKNSSTEDTPKNAKKPEKKYDRVSTDRLTVMISQMVNWRSDAIFVQNSLVIKRPAIEQHLTGDRNDGEEIRNMQEMKKAAETSHMDRKSRNFDPDKIPLSDSVGYLRYLPHSRIRHKVMSDVNIISVLVYRSHVSNEDLQKMFAVGHALEKVDSFMTGLPRFAKIARLKGTGRSYEMVFTVNITHKDLVGDGMEMSPTTLKALLYRAALFAECVDLNRRHALAKELTRSVFYLHTAGILHKNLRPDNIMILQSSQSQSTWKSYLLGFDESRAADQRSKCATDNKGWVNNLYRSKRRQDDDDIEESTTRDDIYSLGVILMEIGFWQPFASDDGRGATKPAEFWYDGTQNDEDIYEMKAAERHAKYLDLLKGTMPIMMGLKYTSIVQKCLECFSSGNEEGDDQPGVEVTAEEILIDLQSISL